jgi:hypothetical protein
MSLVALLPLDYLAPGGTRAVSELAATKGYPGGVSKLGEEKA